MPARAPHLAFVRAERMPDVLPAGFGQVVPDLVAEVVSPSDRAVDVVGEVLARVDATTVPCRHGERAGVRAGPER